MLYIYINKIGNHSITSNYIKLSTACDRYCLVIMSPYLYNILYKQKYRLNLGL